MKHDSISGSARRHTREYTVAPPDNTEQGTAFTSLFIKNTRYYQFLDLGKCYSSYKIEALITR